MPQALTLNSLPLFPLGTVLFPDGLLPLRIFEVRYLDMIGKCHKAGAPFGVVSRMPGVTEAFATVGTLATIVDFATPHTAVLAIRCVGTQRFRITRSEQLRHGLWIADVEQLAGDVRVAVPPDLQNTADALAKLIQSLRLREPDPAQLPIREPMRLKDCGWVANRWCELLPLDPQLKQRLMELDNPLLRLELVGDVLARTGIAN